MVTPLAVFSIFSILNFFVVTLAAPWDDVASHYSSCEHILKRKDWYVVVTFHHGCYWRQTFRRALSDDEKKAYIDAVKCLQSRPARNTSRPASWTRFDEFQAHHIELALQIHSVVSIAYISSYSCSWNTHKGQFLPWHRQYVKVYEMVLCEECGFGGAHP